MGGPSFHYLAFICPSSLDNQGSTLMVALQNIIHYKTESSSASKCSKQADSQIMTH